MGKTGCESLEWMGFRWYLRVATWEAWVGVAVTGTRVVAEATVPWQWGQTHTNPITLHFSLPSPQQQQGQTSTITSYKKKSIQKWILQFFFI